MVRSKRGAKIAMTWTFEQIESEWFGGQYLQMSPGDVEGAFAAAERVRGRDWVPGSEFDLGSLSLPGLGRRGGYSQFLRVYSFGKRLQSLSGAAGEESLIEHLVNNDPSAESELTAIHLLRSRRPESVVEIEPTVTVGDRQRRPDFRIRDNTTSWTYVEVNQLNQSAASASTQDTLRRIAEHISSILQPFLLEIVFWRDPTDGEKEELVRQACEACHTAAGDRRDVRDLASLLVKSGDPTVLCPSILPENDGTRMSLGLCIGGTGEPQRQIMV